MKKFLPYILILIALLGSFGVTEQAQAEEIPTGLCTVVNSGIAPYPMVYKADCEAKLKEVSIERYEITWTNFQTEKTETLRKASTEEQTAETTAKTETPDDRSAFEKKLGEKTCNFFKFNAAGCLANIYYYGIFQLVALILALTALFFDAIMSLALSSDLFTKTTFISSAWAVVRDLSNIFFILILLYVAIEIILDMAHDAQKTIARVVIIALLINFSMFFTQIIIDTSNVLALVFYNKLKVTTKSGQEINYQPITKNGTDKDVAGALYNSFDATKLIKPEFFGESASIDVNLPGQPPAKTAPGPGVYLGIIIVASAIMLFASYCFAVSGFFFISRLIELFILIIFSPFAFMSFTIPFLSNIEYLGWDAWFKRLLKVSFMAPIFMFFLYLIFLLIKSDLFGSMLSTDTTFIQKTFSIVIPAIMILFMLLKAVSFAKAGSGAIGEAVMTGAKFVGGLALGAVTGGAALALSGSVGRKALKTAGREDLKSLASGEVDAKTKNMSQFAGMEIGQIKEHADFEKMQANAQKRLARANKYANKSFDIRDTGVARFVGKQTGVDVDRSFGVGLDTKSLKGGRKEKVKQKTEKDIKEKEEILKTYEMSEDAERKHNAQISPRVVEYQKDKKEAEEKADALTKEWEEKYKKDLEEKKANHDYTISDFNEEEFRKNYANKTPEPSPFNEKDFEAAYKNGDRKALKKNFGIEKDEKFESGEVEFVDRKKVNKERREAYAVGLQTEYDKKEAKGALKTFWGEFKKGMKKTVTSPGGIATAAAVTIATGGLGIPLVIAGGGLLQALQSALGAKEDTAKIVNTIRKGMDEKTKLLNQLKKWKEEEEKTGESNKKSEGKEKAPEPKESASTTNKTSPTQAHHGQTTRK